MSNKDILSDLETTDSTSTQHVMVKDLIDLPSLRNSYILGGRNGLMREVSSANVMEVPDIEPYVSAGEFLLTTAYPLRERPEDFVDLLPKFAQLGLAGVGLKVGRYLNELPEGIIEKADELDFPLLLLPDSASFNQIITEILASVLAYERHDGLDTEKIRERLTWATLSGEGLSGIAFALQNSLHREVKIILTPNTADPQASADWPWRYPVIVGGKSGAEVLIKGNRKPNASQQSLIQQACFATGLYLAQNQAMLELDRRFQILFLEELLRPNLGNSPNFQNRVFLQGWNLNQDLAVVVAHSPVFLPDSSGFQLATELINRPAFKGLQINERVLAWSRGKEIILIIAYPNGEHRENQLDIFVQAWYHCLSQYLHTSTPPNGVVVAASNKVSEAINLPEAYQNAIEALELAKLTHRSWVTHSSLHLERLLRSLDAKDAHNFVQETVGVLLNYDATEGTELASTLRLYLACGSGTQTAKELFIHYNTFKQRLQRIEELTALNLKDPAIRTSVLLALELARIRRVK